MMFYQYNSRLIFLLKDDFPGRDLHVLNLLFLCIWECRVNKGLISQQALIPNLSSCSLHMKNNETHVLEKWTFSPWLQSVLSSQQLRNIKKKMTDKYSKMEETLICFFFCLSVNRSLSTHHQLCLCQHGDFLLQMECQFFAERRASIILHQQKVKEGRVQCLGCV